MGNSFTCFSPKDVQRTHKPRNPENDDAPPQIRRVKGRKSAAGFTEKEREKMGDEVVRQQALEAMLLFKQRNGNQPVSLKQPDKVLLSSSTTKKQKIPRSSSSRTRNSADSLFKPHHLVPQEADNGKPRFVLVHGGGFGAWCWYKNIALLESDGFRVDAVDLAGAGIESSDSNTILTIEDYARPLVDFLQKLNEGKKVILVGHDLGGVCVAKAMELFPSKISKAVFVAAAMLRSDQSVLDMFAHPGSEESLMPRARVLVYGGGEANSPTAIDLDREVVKEMLFNESPPKDIALASVSMRPIPFAPVTEKLSLSERGGYASVRRYYIKTQNDYAIPLSLQETMIRSDPPEQVFQLRGSDHSPFFSRPQALHRLLVDIADVTEKTQPIPARRSCAL